MRRPANAADCKPSAAFGSAKRDWKTKTIPRARRTAMSKPVRPDPPDQLERLSALDSGRPILVQAPAGSGNTDLLARRFLRRLGEVDEPGQIVAITSTYAAAAEMRHRILAELEKATANPVPEAEESAMAARP